MVLVWFDGRAGIGDSIATIVAAVQRGGRDVVQRERTGELAMFRSCELAAALNRIRSLRTVSPRPAAAPPTAARATSPGRGGA
jgi:hypothetical protein